MITRLIYLLLFVSPQLLLFLYLRERLPDPTRPERARRVRLGLATIFALFNLPWVLVAGRALSGSMWGVGRIPYLGPWIAWQLLGWIFAVLVAAYVIVKLVVRGSRELGSVRARGRRVAGTGDDPLTAPGPRSSRRRFLARATYSYAAAGAALSTYGIGSAYGLPRLTRRTLTFPTLPPGLDGLTLLHLSDLHAGIHLGGDRMQEIVRQVNALAPDLIVQTGDMIDISRTYIPPYVHAFRELRAPLGIVTVLGNHDRYTGEPEVIRGCRDAGQILLQNDCQLLERGGATLALLGIDDPHNWTADDPQPADVAAALRRAPAPAPQAGGSDGSPPAWFPGHSLPATRSITSDITPSHTAAHNSTAPGFTEPSALPCAMRLSRPRRKSRATLRLSSSSRSAWRCTKNNCATAGSRAAPATSPRPKIGRAHV